MPDQITSITIICEDDPGLEKYPLKPEHIPSAGDTIWLDGIECTCRKTTWRIDNGMAQVTVSLSCF